jgi:Ca2+/Na+ antiporter
VSTAKSILAQSVHHGSGASDQHSAFATTLGISSIIGSGMMAFTLIPGACALAVPRTLRLKRRPLLRDVLGYVVALALLHATILQRVVSFQHAACMLCVYGLYLVVIAAAPSLRESYRVRVSGLPPRGSITEHNKPAHDMHTPQLGIAASLTESLDPNGGADFGEGEENNEPVGPVIQTLAIPFRPIFSLLSATCPGCEVGGAQEALYGVTLLAAFLWLATYSTVLLAVVTRWGMLLRIPATVMGMYVVAVGAQIPDTVQAIAVARRGHGSMAVASAVGSQVINILIGLGLPWTMSGAVDRPIRIADRLELIQMVWAMWACIGAYLLILVTPTLPTWCRQGTASLGRREGAFLIAAYFAAVLLYAVESKLHIPY